MRYARLAFMAEPGDRLAAALRHTYENAKLTQAAIAAALGVEQTTVSKWAKGQNQPPLEALPVIEQLAGVTVGTNLRRAGLVEDLTDVRSAIAADPVLTDKSKGALGLLYDVLSDQDAAAARRPAGTAHTGG